jgi:hypothetical protein
VKRIKHNHFYLIPEFPRLRSPNLISITSDTGRKILHQRVTRCILISLVGIRKLHSVGLRGPRGLSGELPESPLAVGLNINDPIFLIRHGSRLKPDGPDFWQPWLLLSLCSATALIPTPSLRRSPRLRFHEICAST